MTRSALKMRRWKYELEFLRSFDELISASTSPKMKGCRRHPRGDIVTGRKEPSLCPRSRHGEGARGEKSERKVERGGESGAKRQEELGSLSSRDSPRICMRGRLGPVEISIRRWLPRGIAYNTIYYGGPPARRNLNRAAWTPPSPGNDGCASSPLPTDLH